MSLVLCKNYYSLQKFMQQSIVKKGMLKSGTTSFTCRCFSEAQQLVGWDVQPAILENRLHKPEDVGRESNIENHRFIGTITLQSEGTLNALTVEMGKEFSNMVREIAHDITTGQQKVDVVVLTGAGDTAFSAGGDLTWLRSLRNNTVHANVDLMLQFYKSFLCIRSIPFP